MENKLERILELKRAVSNSEQQIGKLKSTWPSVHLGTYNSHVGVPDELAGEFKRILVDYYKKRINDAKAELETLIK